jgi:gliding motility-associated-like protein
MKKRTVHTFLLFTFISTVIWAQDSFSQLPSNKQDPPKATLKDGKFYFYSPSFLNKTRPLKTGLNKALPAPCYHCKLNQSANRSVITGGPIILYITSQNATCGYGSGSIIVQAANGTAPYSFSVDGLPPQPNGNFPVEGSGIHTIKVTDAGGAMVTTQVTLTDILPGPILVPLFVTSYPSSCSASNGVVQVMPVGGTPPYTYSMDLINFQASNIFSNLASGLYNIYVKDANGCIGIGTALPVAGDCDATSGIASGYECGNDGILTATDINLPDNGPYLYSLDGINYQNTGNFNNIPAGVHTLYIKDKNGKIQIFGFNEAEDCEISIQYIAVSAACMQNDGSMTVTAANGSAPYSYTIDGINYQNSNIFNGLAPGNYYITVKDANGVKSSLPAMVYDRCPVVEAVSSPETCATNDGVITAAGFKGTQPYQYSIDGTNFQPNNSFPGLPAGNYTITIKDALGFTGFIQIAVNYDCLSASAVAVAASCGNSNGSITLTAINGAVPYSYSLDGINFQPGNIFNNLVAGAYTITVKDANGLTRLTSITIPNSQGPQINAVANPASCLNNDGTVQVSIINGVAPFQYSDDGINFQNTGLFSALDTGMKSVIVKDANGCISSLNIVVQVINNLTVDAGNDITICEGKNGTLNAGSNGNSFSWSPTASLMQSASLSPVAAPLTTTKFYLTARLGICSKTDSAMVYVNPAPIADAGINISTCYGKTIQLHGSGGTNYIWSPDTYLDYPANPDPMVIKPINTTTYQLTVTDNNNCSSIQPARITVTVTAPAKVFAGNDTSVLKNQSLQLNALDVNNSGFDSYIWSPSAGLNNSGIQNPVAMITKDIVYTVTATTPDGCEGEGSVSIKVFTFSDIFVPNAFTPNGDGRNDILKPILIGIKELRLFTVFNRWGQRVYSTKNQGTGWDGTISGQLQESGTYVWMAEGIDFNGITIHRQGTVVLIR